MAKWLHADVLDNGPAHIKANCDKLYLISAYTAGDSFATVFGNKLAEAAMSSTDFTHGSSSSNRTLTTASGKTGTASASSATPNLHLAFVDEAGSQVLWVTDETSDQAITSGNTVNFPSVVLTTQQPT